MAVTGVNAGRRAGRLVSLPGFDAATPAPAAPTDEMFLLAYNGSSACRPVGACSKNMMRNDAQLNMQKLSVRDTHSEGDNR